MGLGLPARKQQQLESSKSDTEDIAEGTENKETKPALYMSFLPSVLLGCKSRLQPRTRVL